ncbi:MAG: tetratricopeptide repeat protein [Myxococcales bacterium]|nr:tetratricopeptide repeat protein [Myxococcales bacterium]
MSEPTSPFRWGFLVAAVACGALAACGWDPQRPFERESPVVNRALAELDAGEAGVATAAELLQGYLSTGACSESAIGTPKSLHEKPNGALDLGIALFRLGESFGARFGDEEAKAGRAAAPTMPGAPSADGLRASHIECALRIVRAVAEDPTQPVELRARARYLEGNLLFLDAKYKEAVAAYDKALVLAPGMPEGGVDAQGGPRHGDPLGLDAAWNRAVALQRIEDKKDAGQDAGQDGGQDGGLGGQDGGGDSGSQDSGGQDSSKDGSNGDRDSGKDSGKDSGGEDAAPPPQKNEDAAAPPPPPPSERSQDERLLDQLENAPTVQREAARRQKRGGVKVRGSEDK